MFEYTKNKWMTAFKDLAKVMYAVIKVITFPVWATRWIYIKINNARR
jgi:hypothetical protein